MSSIRSFSEILLRTPDLERAQAERFLHIIHDESIRMTRLLDGILDLSVLEGAGASWALTRTDPEVALENAIAICEGLTSVAAVRLLREVRAREVRVMADGDRLCQVFINLISNAIKFNTSADAVVRIESAERGGAYEVRISDNGPGIPSAERDQLFSKFARGWAQTHSPAQGAGLGLAISWQIMRRMGGTLELMPDQGRGACFCVRLPSA